MRKHLTIQRSWLVTWLLVKRVCPVYLVERWGYSPGVVVAINQLWNFKLNHSWQHGGYVAELPLLKPWFHTVEMPNLFCLTARELAWSVQMMGEIMWLCVGDVSWFLQNGRDWRCGNSGAGVCGQTVEDGCNSLLMPVQMWSRWGISMGAEWAAMETFYWKSMGGRRGRNSVGGGGGRGRDRMLNFVACGAWIVSWWVVVATWRFVKHVYPVHLVNRYDWILGCGEAEENVLCWDWNREMSSLEFGTWP